MSINNINITFWNANGLKSRFDELCDYLSRYKVDIALLTETWLSVDDKLKYNSKYLVYRLDRSPVYGKRGGVAIIVHRNINSKILPRFSDLSLIETIAISIPTSIGELKLISVYFPGLTSPVTKKKCLEKFGSCEINKIRYEYQQDLKQLFNFNSNTIVCGDLNSKHSAWNCFRGNPAGKILYNYVSRSSSISLLYPNSHSYIPIKK